MSHSVYLIHTSIQNLLRYLNLLVHLFQIFYLEITPEKFSIA